MKVISPVPFKTCRNCVYNDFKRVGVDYCVRAKCIYTVIPNDTGAEAQPQEEGGKVERCEK